MKRIILSAFLAVSSVLAPAQNRADRQDLTDPGSSSFILFGDPQLHGPDSASLFLLVKDPCSDPCIPEDLFIAGNVYFQALIRLKA